jgi:ubiquinone biosynthesis protein Coq4
MIKFRQLVRATRLMREGRLGDGAILKADALGARVSPGVEARLADVRSYLPRIDLDALARLPPGTFGRAYADHMRDHALAPFEVSDDLDPGVLGRNTFAARYAVTHDIFHVLLGFDTRLPGEMGVLAFAVAQGYARAQWVALAFALVLYPLLAPREAGRTFRCFREGWRLGRGARFLLGVRFEERWERPLAELRRELGLPATPGAAGAPTERGRALGARAEG